MTRQTSIDAYYGAINRGSIENKKWLVFDSLLKHCGDDGITSSEVWQFMVDENKLNKIFDSNTSNTRSRFTELRSMGLIKELKPRPCKITGITCIAWYPTWSTDVKKLTKKITKDKRIKQLEALLVEACDLIDNRINLNRPTYSAENYQEFLNKPEIQGFLK